MKHPFDFIVTDIQRAQELIQQQWPTRIITLLGRNNASKPFIESTGPHHLRVVVDDICQPQAGGILPSRRMVEEILNFSQSFTPQDKVLVHCRYGLGRSTSVMIGLLVQHGVHPMDAIAVVHGQRPLMDSNEMFLYHFDNALHKGLQLMDAYDTWCKTVDHAPHNRLPRIWWQEIKSNIQELIRTGQY
jgi:predicted protein tyrosine phosphatase